LRANGNPEKNSKKNKKNITENPKTKAKCRGPKEKCWRKRQSNRLQLWVRKRGGVQWVADAGKEKLSQGH